MRFLPSALLIAAILVAVAGGATAATEPSVAALGDSISLGFSTTGTLAPAPANSWITGTNPAVQSILTRAHRLHLAVGQAVNAAVAGSTMAQLAAQVPRIPVSARLVTVEIGTLDACAAPNVVASTFGSDFDGALTAIETRAPHAQIAVVSIFDLAAMWRAVQADRAARAFRSLCLTVTSHAGAVDRAVRSLNTELATVCARHQACRTDGGAAYRLHWTRADISSFDYFHPSVAGQRKIAAALWSTRAIKDALR